MLQKYKVYYHSSICRIIRNKIEIRQQNTGIKNQKIGLNFKYRIITYIINDIFKKEKQIKDGISTNFYLNIIYK